MKIHPAASLAPERDRLHPAQGGRPARADATAAAAPSTSTTSTTSTDATTAPASVVPSTVVEVSHKAPPGLQKVLARLEAMGPEGRSAGQSHAMERIARNLQRYLDHQGVEPAPAPAPSPADTTPVAAEPAVEGTPVEVPLPAPPTLPGTGSVTAPEADLLPDPAAEDEAAPTTPLLLIA